MEALVSLWEMISPAHELLIAISISLATSAILWFFRTRVNVQWGSTSLNVHQFRLAPDKDPIIVATEQYYIQNVGRKEATGVEIVLSSIPTSYRLWPSRDHNTRFLENGHFIINVPFLAPRELLVIDMIDLDRRNPELLTVNCPDNLTKRVEFDPQKRQPKSLLYLVAYLIFAGFVATVYLLLQLILAVV